MPALRLLLLVLLAWSTLVAAGAQTRIEDRATLRYRTADGVERETVSATVTLLVETSRRASRIEWRVPTDDAACPAPGDPLAVIAPDRLAAMPVPDSVDPVAGAGVVLTAPGSNRDPARRETVGVTLGIGDRSVAVTLAETAADSGVFAGVMAGAACGWPAVRDDAATATFAGDAGSLPAATSRPIDPAGQVFDAATGAPVDGASVTLVADDGSPAAVLGDDGASRYPATVTSGGEAWDEGGHRYPAVKGRYRFPMVPPGRYRLRIVPPPGYGEPTATPAMRRDTAGRDYRLTPASAGAAVTLNGRRPFAADIALAPMADAALLSLTRTASLRVASAGDLVELRLRVVNRGNRPSGALRLVDRLPPGLRARRSAGATIAGDGRSVAFALPSLAPGAAAEIGYLAAVPPAAPVGEAVARAVVEAAGGGRAAAAIAIRLRRRAVADALFIVGRVSEGACNLAPAGRRGVAGARVLLDDGSFALSDADGLFHLEGVTAGRHVVALDTASVDPALAAVDCARDTRAAGSATSRFVEGGGGTLRRADFHLIRSAASPAAAAALPAVPDDATAAGARDWLAGQRPGIAWLFPAPGYNPRAPVTRVAIKHLPGQRVALTIGGRGVDALRFEATEADAHGVAVSRWAGVALAPGDNRLEARVLGADGGVVATLDRVVTVSGPPRAATLDAAHSRLVADGLTPPLVAVRLTDVAGRPVRAGTPVAVTVEPPQALAADPALAHRRGVGAASVAVIGDEGLAYIALRPTGQAGAARITLALDGGDTVRRVPVEAWLTAAARGWTLVGFAAGTAGWRTLSRRATALPDGTVDDGGAGRVSFYAKGRIRGAWLLTMAYDSARRRDRERPLFGAIDPDRYYTVYGDGGVQEQDAPTRGPLYVRLERGAAQALFGDLDTGFVDTRLSRYSRTVTGLKASARGRGWAAGAFAADTDSVAGRDEIGGNGLAGPYRLRARAIVPGSDRLRVETRDRYRPEVIRASTPLVATIDYDLDPDTGTVRLRQPLLSRDAAGDPQFLVAEYEVARGPGRRIAGARAAGSAGAVAVGATALRDETLGGGALLGLDARVRIDAATELRGEVAAGGWHGLGSGRALLAEAEHRGRSLALLGYWREQATRFGLGQQELADLGTRKLGTDLRWAIDDRLTLTATGWRQWMLGGPGERTAGEARLAWRHNGGTVFVGVQGASDRGLDGGARASRLLTLGGSRALAGGAVDVTGQVQLAVGGAASSVDFPARHQLTLGWRLSPALRLIGGYEVARGAGAATRTAQVGVDLTPWAGASLGGTLNRQAAVAGGRRYAQYRLGQSLPLGGRWSLDATLDSVRTLRGAVPAAGAVNAFRPVAPGGEAGDFTAAGLGATWRVPRWTATARIEARRGAGDRRLGITASVLHPLAEGRTLAAAGRLYRVTDAAGRVASTAAGDVALAWRPPASDWSVLERLTLRHDAGDPVASAAGGSVLGTAPVVAGAGARTTRAVNDLALHYRRRHDGSGAGLEASVGYGVKYVRGRYGDDLATGFVDLVATDLRRSLGPHLDIGIAASVEHGWTDRVWAWSGGPSLGLSPARSLWLTFGYNVAGYRDRDFAADRWTRAGPYLTLRAKVDGHDLGAWLRGRS